MSILFIDNTKYTLIVGEEGDVVVIFISLWQDACDERRIYVYTNRTRKVKSTRTGSRDRDEWTVYGRTYAC